MLFGALFCLRSRMMHTATMTTAMMISSAAAPPRIPPISAALLPSNGSRATWSVSVVSAPLESVLSSTITKVVSVMLVSVVLVVDVDPTVVAALAASDSGDVGNFDVDCIEDSVVNIIKDVVNVMADCGVSGSVVEEVPKLEHVVLRVHVQLVAQIFSSWKNCEPAIRVDGNHSRNSCR